MFGPDRGGWQLDWQGWWGPEPPYHAPVFVLAHRPRAGERNVSIAGGPATLNQYLAAGLVDELRLHVTPTILGSGERVFGGVPSSDWEQVSSRGATTVTHLVYRPVR